MIVSIVARILAALYSNKRPGEVAAGVALGVWAAFLPSGTPFFWGVFLSIFFMKVNQAIALLALALVTPIAVTLDPVFHRIGFLILGSDALYSFWSRLYALPLVRFTRFNNTVVLGTLVCGAAVFPLVFFAVRAAVVPIRTRVVPKIAASAIAQKLYKTPIVVKLVAAFQRWSGFFDVVGG